MHAAPPVLAMLARGDAVPRERGAAAVTPPGLPWAHTVPDLASDRLLKIAGSWEAGEQRLLRRGVGRERGSRGLAPCWGSPVGLGSLGLGCMGSGCMGLWCTGLGCTVSPQHGSAAATLGAQEAAAIWSPQQAAPRASPALGQEDAKRSLADGDKLFLGLGRSQSAGELAVWLWLRLFAGFAALSLVRPHMGGGVGGKRGALGAQGNPEAGGDRWALRCSPELPHAPSQRLASSWQNRLKIQG